MILFDNFTIDGVRRTSDGYVAAFARVARTGIQEYRGHELGRPDLDIVRVYRPPSEVFNADAMKSFSHRPVTLKHPKVPVTARNWKKYAGGQTGDEVVRDGEFVRVPMVMMDQGLIDAYEKQGVKELSMGYSTDIKWRTGVVDAGEPDAGQTYDAVQTAIRGNHLAVVPLARGGDLLRIGDTAFRDLVGRINDKDEDDDEHLDDASLEDVWSEAARAAALESRRSRSTAHGDMTKDLRARGFARKDHYKASGGNPSVTTYHHRDASGRNGVEVQLWGNGQHRVSHYRNNESGRSPTDFRTVGQMHAAIDKHRSAAKIKDSSPSDDDDYTDCPECGADMPPDSSDCPECGYHVTKPTKDGATIMKRIVIDSVPVDVSDEQGAAIIERHVRSLLTQVADATTKLTDQQAATVKVQTALDAANASVSAKDGEIAVLKKKVEDSAITPAKLDEMVKDRMVVIDAATPLLDKTFAFDGKTVAEIKKAAVEAYLGDAAKGMSEGAIDGAFVAATMDAAKNNTGGSQPIRRAVVNGGGRLPVGDARQTAYDERVARLSGAWKKPVVSA